MCVEKADQALLYASAEGIEIYKKDVGRYPKTLSEMKAPNYHVNQDVEGHLPHYQLSSDGKTFELISLGVDGKYGTADDIKYDPSKKAKNTLPMYGGLDVVKTPFQLELDKKFIQNGIQIAGSREKACQDVIRWAWEFVNQGALLTAMRRFNQAWLLDPNNPEVYKGFATVLRKQGNVEGALKIEQMARGK